MGMLVLGLVLFLGAHSVRIFADNARTRAIARLGEMGWKGLYSVVSLIGFGLTQQQFALAGAGAGRAFNANGEAGLHGGRLSRAG